MLRLIRTWLCWIVPSGIKAALMTVSPPSTRPGPNLSVRTSIWRTPLSTGAITLSSFIAGAMA
jgi:hypothetical protein